MTRSGQVAKMLIQIFQIPENPTKSKTKSHKKVMFKTSNLSTETLLFTCK